MKQRSPFRKSFIPSRRHILHAGPVYLAIDSSLSGSQRSLGSDPKTGLRAQGVSSRSGAQARRQKSSHIS